jgi:hypothetical protein
LAQHQERPGAIGDQPASAPLILPQQRAPRPAIDPAAFFDAVAAAYQRAVRAAGATVERDYLMGGYHVRLTFAGPALAPRLTRALAHLVTDADGQPDLTIGLWETDTTSVAPPPPPWDYSDFNRHRRIDKFSTDSIHVHYQLGVNALSLVDSQHNQAYYWIKAASQIPYWDVGAPLRNCLSLWLNRHGRALLHAGAVGLPEGGVLLAGPGGSGKSNTTLSTLLSPLRYAGDDFTLLSLNPQPTVFSLYCSGKVHAADLARLPFLAPSLANPDQLDEEKALFFLDQHWPDKLLTSFPIKAVLLPHVTGRGESRLRRASAAQGLNALAPTTLDLSPAVEREVFLRLVALFRHVPCYHLDLGPDRAQPAELILQLLTASQPGAAPGALPDRALR